MEVTSLIQWHAIIIIITIIVNITIITITLTMTMMIIQFIFHPPHRGIQPEGLRQTQKYPTCL